MAEQIKGEKNPDSCGTKRKQRCRNSDSYEKDMNKFLTIIYHNINRLHEEKTPMRKSCSEPHQLELCGTQEPPLTENSVSRIHRFGRRHSDFALPLSQVERSNCPKDFKRKVAFADTLTEKSRKSCSEPHQLELCRTQELPFMENSVSGIYMSGRRHSDFALPLSQLERSNCPKDFKRKAAFSDTLTEESNFPL